LAEERRLRVFEKRVLRRILVSKRVEVIGKWKKLLNEKLHNLYLPPTIVRVIKLRTKRREGHVAPMG
jgi:hypothetical protein